MGFHARKRARPRAEQRSGIFATAGIPLLRGRTVTKRDGVGFDANHPRLGSILISESVANSGVSILLHTAVEPHSVITAARNEIRKLDLAVYRVQTLEELIGGSTSDRQFSMLLFAAFAGLAVLLAAVGLYGLVSYAISQRKTEIGIRMALGATNSEVSGLMLMQELTPPPAPKCERLRPQPTEMGWPSFGRGDPRHNCQCKLPCGQIVRGFCAHGFSRRLPRLTISDTNRSPTS